MDHSYLQSKSEELESLHQQFEVKKDEIKHVERLALASVEEAQTRIEEYKSNVFSLTSEFESKISAFQEQVHHLTKERDELQYTLDDLNMQLERLVRLRIKGVRLPLSAVTSGVSLRSTTRLLKFISQKPSSTPS